MHHVKLILLLSLCIGLSANAQTPYDSFAPETSRPILTSEALSKEKCAQDFSSDTTLLVAMIDTQQERILLVDMSDGSIVAYAPLTDNKCHMLSPLYANIEKKMCDDFSDAEWIMWFTDSLDMNVEIKELRNEYLFCRLESGDSEHFIAFLYSAINEQNKEKIKKELQRPLHDDVDIEKCMNNISISKATKRFKKWLIRQLKFGLSNL